MQTIRVNIIKTAEGYDLKDPDRNYLIGTIRQGRNNPLKWRWDTFGDGGWGDIEQALYTLKEVLSQRAANLGCNIEFINI